MQPSFPASFGKIVSRFLEDMACPRSLTVAILLRNEEFGQLVELRCRPDQYRDADSYYRACIATEFLRKTKGLPTGIDLRAKALDSFWKSEAQCAKSNARLGPLLRGGPHDVDSLRIMDVVEEIRRFIAGVLGKLPNTLYPKFGPGSTLEDRGHYTLVPDKLTSRPTGTRASLCLEPIWSPTSWARALMHDRPYRSSIKIVRGNRFDSVPKDSGKDRGIAVEPSFNVAYQLPLGREIKRRLYRIGIDLIDGQSLHSQMAKEGSQSGTYCTIDLSSASDTVCSSLVQLLLPEDWYTLLETLRSPTTYVEGQSSVQPPGWTGRGHVFLEKFSSMGNGYTFELETLLFLAIAVVGCRRCNVEPTIGVNLSVYGDDIIIPQECSRVVLSLLRYFGFTPNPEKTFDTGPFRESCGGDFYDGWAVRPFYLKEFPSEPQHFISLANGIRRLVSDDTPPAFDRDRTHRTWLGLLEALPTAVRRLRGPASLGDLVLTDDEPARWQVRTHEDGYREIRVYKPLHYRVALKHWSPRTQLAALLYGVSSEGASPRNNVSGYKEGWITLDGVRDPSKQFGWSWYHSD